MPASPTGQKYTEVILILPFDLVAVGILIALSREIRAWYQILTKKR
jgi:hypothetical protein